MVKKIATRIERLEEQVNKLAGPVCPECGREVAARLIIHDLISPEDSTTKAPECPTCKRIKRERGIVDTVICITCSEAGIECDEHTGGIDYFASI
jgi:ribosomal protein L37AE/L43A